MCGSTILSQHGYITGINPVDDAAKGAATHKCAKKHVVWMTETGVGAPHAGEDKRTTAPAERRACKRLHRRLVKWYDDPRVTAAFQYTFREDDVFPHRRWTTHSRCSKDAGWTAPSRRLTRELAGLRGGSARAVEPDAITAGRARNGGALVDVEVPAA